jgi:hypothetical protein
MDNCFKLLLKLSLDMLKQFYNEKKRENTHLGTYVLIFSKNTR